MSVMVRLADDLDVGRGDLLASPAEAPPVARELEATVCWMADAPLRPGAKLRLKHTTRTVRATVEALLSRVDVAQLRRAARARPARAQRHRPRAAAHRRAGDGRALRPQPGHGRVRARRRAHARHRRGRHGARGQAGRGRHGGRAGLGAAAAGPRASAGRRSACAARRSGCAAPPELLGDAGAAVERALVDAGRGAYLLDGGLSQQGLAPGRLARLFADSGAVAVVALPAASAELRREARELHAAAGLHFEDLHIPDGEPSERTAERVLEALEGGPDMRKLALVAVIGLAGTARRRRARDGLRAGRARALRAAALLGARRPAGIDPDEPRSKSLPALCLAPLGTFAGVHGRLRAAAAGGRSSTPALLSTGRIEPRQVIGSVDASEFAVALGRLPRPSSSPSAAARSTSPARARCSPAASWRRRSPPSSCRSCRRACSARPSAA